ncbi:MAG: hypothetical protein JWM03_1948 [Rhodocyclales bacterium]|nr:hypothetical protein [Rhodocyclales bacterium]MDB5889076.1 hypothetical protein [Rhodocyclales bacterium]
MKTREVVIFSGKKFTVPQGIQRIDSRSTHGWQVRCLGTKLFSDHTQDGSGAHQALEDAKKELVRRMIRLSAQPVLRKAPRANKKNDLPVGISGPIIRSRPGWKARQAYFSVVLPRAGYAPGCATVYIANENTYTIEKYREALEKAMALREQAEQAYEIAMLKARRKTIRDMKAAVR